MRKEIRKKPLSRGAVGAQPERQDPRVVHDTLIQALDAVPTTWLDPILTGPTAAIGKPPYGCPDIERVLTAVRERIAAIAKAEGR